MKKLFLLVLAFCLGNSLQAGQKSREGAFSQQTKDSTRINPIQRNLSDCPEEECFAYREITSDGQKMTGWIGIMGNGTLFVISDSVRVNGRAPLVFDANEPNNARAIAYHEDFNQWVGEMCSQIIPRELQQAIVRKFREQRDIPCFQMNFTFAPDGEVVSFDLVTTTDLYRELPRETFTRLAFRMKETTVPLAGHHDFSRRNYGNYAQETISGFNILEENGEFTREMTTAKNDSTGIIAAGKDLVREEISFKGQTMEVWTLNTGNDFSISNSRETGIMADFVFANKEKNDPRVVAYNKEFTRWAREICEEIIPADKRKTLMTMFRDSEDIYFWIQLFFNREGKVKSFSFFMPEEVHDNFPRKTLTGMIFQVVDLQVPFTMYYDFYTNQGRGIPSCKEANILIDVCHVLRNGTTNFDRGEYAI